MSKEILCEIKDKIAEADLVLVGIGEQIAVPTKLMIKDEKYSIYLEDESKIEYLPYLQQIFIKEKEQDDLDIYNRLSQLLAGKNY